MKHLRKKVLSLEAATLQKTQSLSSNDEKLSLELKSDFLLFTKYFFKARTGKDFVISQPVSRQSHHVQISDKLNSIFHGDKTRALIHCPPRYGKTELMIHFIAWTLANYPDSQYIYISYSARLATKQTAAIRSIVSHPDFSKLFNVKIRSDSRAKDSFETTAGGAVYAAGSGGTITGYGAGVANVKRWGGCIAIDDIHKPSEVTSDTIRQSEVDWYIETAQSRVNSATTPIIGIGQILHEDDLFCQLGRGLSGESWDITKILALDEAENALDPVKHSKSELLRMRDTMPYWFAAQYQQTPQPAGGGVFKKAWFKVLDFTPEMLGTFITCDTAETANTYNDATVFSFWGVYKIKHGEIDTGLYGLHWLDCLETWVEPKDLESTFYAFYGDCMRFEEKPKLTAIEKKSTGVTLVSLLQNVPGLTVYEIERGRGSGSKTARFLESQPYIAGGRVSFTNGAKHVSSTIEHMAKITVNDSHRRDDIADTCADAIKLALIDQLVIRLTSITNRDEVMAGYTAFHQQSTKALQW